MSTGVDASKFQVLGSRGRVREEDTRRDPSSGGRIKLHCGSGSALQSLPFYQLPGYTIWLKVGDHQFRGAARGATKTSGFWDHRLAGRAFPEPQAGVQGHSTFPTAPKSSFKCLARLTRGGTRRRSTELSLSWTSAVGKVDRGGWTQSRVPHHPLKIPKTKLKKTKPSPFTQLSTHPRDLGLFLPGRTMQPPFNRGFRSCAQIAAKYPQPQ